MARGDSTHCDAVGWRRTPRLEAMRIAGEDAEHGPKSVTKSSAAPRDQRRDRIPSNASINTAWRAKWSSRPCPKHRCLHISLGVAPYPPTPRTPPPGTQLPGDIEVIPPPHSGLDVFCGTPLDIRYSYARRVHSSDVSNESCRWDDARRADLAGMVRGVLVRLAT